VTGGDSGPQTGPGLSPNLCLIYGSHVTPFVGKVSAIGQPTRPTQPSIHPGRQISSNPYNRMGYVRGDHLTADRGCVCIFGHGLKSVGAGLAYACSLYARSVCDTKAPLRLVALCKCYP